MTGAHKSLIRKRPAKNTCGVRSEDILEFPRGGFFFVGVGDLGVNFAAGVEVGDELGDGAGRNGGALYDHCQQRSCIVCRDGHVTRLAAQDRHQPPLAPAARGEVAGELQLLLFAELAQPELPHEAVGVRRARDFNEVGNANHRLVADGGASRGPELTGAALKRAHDDVTRAEPRTGDGKRPPTGFCRTQDRITTIWPVKLVLAPKMAAQLVKDMETSTHPQITLPMDLPRPELAPRPWETARWSALV